MVSNETIDEIIELLRQSKNFFKVILIGHKTNLVIEKPEEKEEKKEINNENISQEDFNT